MKESFTFSENVLGYMIKTEIDQEKMEEVLSEIKDRIKKVTPVCIYLEDASDEGISFKGFLKAVEFHFSHSKDLDKIALVSDDAFSQMAMEVKDIIVPSNVKTFKREERIEAMNWVME
jgi:hypothetical protein